MTEQATVELYREAAKERDKLRVDCGILLANPDDHKRAVFTGHVKPGMAAELLKLSAHFRQLERDLKD